MHSEKSNPTQDHHWSNFPQIFHQAIFLLAVRRAVRPPQWCATASAQCASPPQALAAARSLTVRHCDVSGFRFGNQLPENNLVCHNFRTLIHHPLRDGRCVGVLQQCQTRFHPRKLLSQAPTSPNSVRARAAYICRLL